MEKLLEIVGGGFVINRAYTIYFKPWVGSIQLTAVFSYKFVVNDYATSFKGKIQLDYF